MWTKLVIKKEKAFGKWKLKVINHIILKNNVLYWYTKLSVTKKKKTLQETTWFCVNKMWVFSKSKVMGNVFWSEHTTCFCWNSYWKKQFLINTSFETHFSLHYFDGVSNSISQPSPCAVILLSCPSSTVIWYHSCYLLIGI